MVGYEWHDFVGNIGVLLILVMYLAVQLDKVDVTKLPYILMNGVGAGLIVFSLTFNFNLSAFIIESAWLLISLFGLARRFYLGRSVES